MRMRIDETRRDDVIFGVDRILAFDRLFGNRDDFAAFDADDNGYLDYDELDQFLDVFYAADSIFAGDARLPGCGLT